MATFQKITPHLWFDQNAEEAVSFYTYVFRNCKIGALLRYGKAGYDVHKMSEGTVMSIEFELEGQKFVALNGGPIFKFSEAISFIVQCHDQTEIDYYWDALSMGGDPESQKCGWLKDKFGVSWQIVPTSLSQIMEDADEITKDRVLTELLQMKKLDKATLETAAQTQRERSTS